MASERNRERAELYRDVEYEHLSPAEAEAQLQHLGLTPFESRPDPSSFDPMREDEWTLPMAAAWFIWRSPDAVRDQWNVAREGWRKWVRIPKRGSIVGGPKGPRLKLKSFGPATLADVFSQAGLPHDAPTRNSPALESVVSDRVHTPYSRLKAAMQSGDLKATWGQRGEEDFEELSSEYWLRKFEAIANPKRQSSFPRTDPPKARSSAGAVTLRKATVEQPAIQLPPSNVLPSNPDELEDLPDLSLTEALTSETQRGRRGVAVPYDENCDIFVRREDVILAEQKITEIEYEQADWNLGQALGWVAYQRRRTFRSLWETDINPRPEYYGEAYSTDFVIGDPAGTLKEGLLSETLKAYRDGELIPSTRWIGSEVWHCPGMRFIRADVIKVWKEIPITIPPKKPPPSLGKLMEVYRSLHLEIGDVPTEKQFNTRLESLGLDAPVRLAREASKRYCDDNKLEKMVGPRRRPRKPHSDT